MREDIEQHFPKYKSDKYGEALLTESYLKKPDIYDSTIVLLNDKFCIEVRKKHSYIIESRPSWMHERTYVEMGWKQFEELFQKVQ